MTTPFFAGFEIVGAGLLGPTEIFVDLESDYDDRFFQLYAGRTRIGVTELVDARRVVGQLQPERSPAPLTVVAVLPADRDTDFGELIPDWPWNRYRLTWSVPEDYASDVTRFEVASGSGPGESVSLSHIVARTPFVGAGDYQVDLPPLGECGEWEFAVVPRDNAKPNGNAGTPSTITITATVPPPDLVADEDGNRFAAAATGGNLTLAYTYP